MRSAGGIVGFMALSQLRKQCQTSACWRRRRFDPACRLPVTQRDGLEPVARATARAWPALTRCGRCVCADLCRSGVGATKDAAYAAGFLAGDLSGGRGVRVDSQRFSGHRADKPLAVALLQALKLSRSTAFGCPKPVQHLRRAD